MVCTEGRLAEARALVQVGGAAVNMEAWSFDDDTAGAHAGEDVWGWKKRRTPLLAAAQNGHTDVTRALLELGGTVDQGTADGGATAVYIGAQEGHVEVVRLLLEKGAAVNQATTAHSQGPGGDTPLRMAAYKGYVEVVRVLLEGGAAVNQATADDGTTPLLIATQQGHGEVVLMLLEKGAAVNQGRTDTGVTPLHMAAQNGYVELARLLLEKGAGVNQATTDHGTPPLHMAAQNGHVDMVRLLLEKGAAVNQARTVDGTTPLFIAAQQGHVDLVHHLAVFGASTTNGSPDGNWTPRSLAAHMGHAALAKWLDAAEILPPLQIAAGCRLYRAATTILRLGLVDPEQGGVKAMLAARVAAASTAPWGEIYVPYAPEEVVLDGDDAFAVAVAARAVAERQHFVTLAHVPVCTLTNKFIRAATSGWSTTQHRLHHIAVRNAVHTLVLVSERRRREAKDEDGGELLPHMPAELWLVIARFFRRSDWPVGAGAVHAAAAP
jgi:ankyrin repeat protein